MNNHLKTWVYDNVLYGAICVTADADFIYVGLGTVQTPAIAPKVVKIDKTTMTTVATWTGAAGQESNTQEIILRGAHLYVALYTTPGKVVDINKGTMTTVATWTGAAGVGEDETQCMALDSSNSFLYLGFDNSARLVNTPIVTIDMDSMVTLETFDTGSKTSIRALCLDSNLLYSGDSPDATSVLTKYSTSPLTKISQVTGLLNSIVSIRVSGNNLYASFLGSAASRVEKYDLRDMTLLSQWVKTGKLLEDLVLGNDGYLYTCAYNTPLQIYKLQTSAMTLKATYTGTINDAYKMFWQGYRLYVACYIFPAKLLELNLPEGTIQSIGQALAKQLETVS